MRSTQKASGKIRIIGGEHRRQQITVLDHLGLRPSSDRVRETVFNWMMHQWGGIFTDKRILDAFTGSGAFGLECVSRGATDVWMLDTYAPAVQHIRHTLNKWQASANIQVCQCDIVQFCTQASEPFDWIIIDPPFGQAWLEKIILAIMPLTHENTWLYVETEIGADLTPLFTAHWQQIRAGKTQQVMYGLWRR